MLRRLKHLWSRGHEVEGAATLLMVTILLSNVLGLLRDVILANTSSLTTLDTYYAAFKIPDFLFNLFILGAISVAFIPVYLEVKTKEGEEAAWQLSHNLLHVALVVLVVVSGILWLFMPQLLPHFVPGFSAEKLSQTIPLARILLLSPFFFGVSYILGAILNANKKFFSYALAPLAYNLAIIVGGFFAPYWGMRGVAWAVVVGALLHALIQLPTLLSLGYRYRFVLNLNDKHLRRIIRLMIPQSLSLGMPQIMLLVFTGLASLLPAGAISIYTLTDHVQTTPTAIFAAAISTAIFPLLGQARSEGNKDKFQTLLTNSLKGMFFFMIPSMALLWVFRAHIIRLFLALNHQTWADTIRAIDTFSWFIVALAAQGFVVIIIRAFYAHQDTRRPMFGAVLACVSAILFARLLLPLIPDVPALSLALALSAMLQAVFLLVLYLCNYPGELALLPVAKTIGVAAIFSLISALLARLAIGIISEGAFINLQGLGTARVVPLFIALVGGSLVGALSYILLAYLSGREELIWVWPKRATGSLLMPQSEEIAKPEGLT